MPLLRERNQSVALELNADRALVFGGIDLDDNLHGRVQPTVDQLASRLFRALSLKDQLPLGSCALEGSGSRSQTQNGYCRRCILRHRRRVPRMRRLYLLSLMGQLDHKAEGLFWVKECFLPARIGVVVADNGVAARLGAITRQTEVRDFKREVVNARAVLGQEAVKKAARSRWLEDLDARSILKEPMAKPKASRTHFKVEFAPKHPCKNRRRIGESLCGNRNVIKNDPIGHRMEPGFAF